jgi:hypothetical protein
MSQRIEGPVPPPGDEPLRHALEEELGRYFGVPRPIARLERRPSPYRTSFALEELTVAFEDGDFLQLMFKDLSRQSLLHAARLAKPPFLHNPQREIDTYRALLTPAALGTPIYYGSVIDTAQGRYWLFIEKVDGKELYQIGEFALWQQVARWLAAMHNHFANLASQSHLPVLPSLLCYERDLYRRWMERAQEYLQPAGLSQDASTHLRRLASGYDGIVERLTALPQTVIHGEFYASNVLLQETPGGLRVCPVDWELAARGPGLLDVAALTAGSWTEEEKRAIALAYLDALSPDLGWQPDPETFLAALDCCYLHLAIQWLGWSPEWSPPPEHAQNWLGEALRRSQKLKL